MTRLFQIGMIGVQDVWIYIHERDERVAEQEKRRLKQRTHGRCAAELRGRGDKYVRWMQAGQCGISGCTDEEAPEAGGARRTR